MLTATGQIEVYCRTGHLKSFLKLNPVLVARWDRGILYAVHADSERPGGAFIVLWPANGRPYVGKSTSIEHAMTTYMRQCAKHPTKGDADDS